MSLSTCARCGGFIPLGPDASNCCVECGHHVFDIAPADVSDLKDARIAALEAEVASLKSGITPPKTPMEGGFSLDKFMPGVTPEDAAAMGEALDAADHDIADAERVIAWARDPNRKPASLAFTAGPERQAAYWIEWAEAAALRAALGKAEEALGNLTSYAKTVLPDRKCPHNEDLTHQTWDWCVGLLEEAEAASSALSLISAARQAAHGGGAEGES